MNIFDIYLKKIKILITNLNKDGLIQLPTSLNGINVDIPPANFDCDISSNVALILSKPNKKSPLDLGKQIADIIKNNNSEIDSISIAKPGFINIKFKLLFWNKFVKEILDINKTFGVNQNIKKKKYLLEFVSANPTGPLHVGHCRGAILGDVIANILIFNEHEVTKEYYVNDYGNQIITFTKSVYLRIREILYKEKFPTEGLDLYPGDYLIDIGKKILLENKDLKFDNFEEISEKLVKLTVEQSLKLIKLNLNNLGIVHDNFVKETEIINNKEVKIVINKLKNNKLVYNGKIKAPREENSSDWVEREQLLFKSTDFGDDKDRALKKFDGSWTYFASDAAYHNNKLNRNFDVLINILGADHAGYIKRISAVVEALSGKKEKLICKVSQLVKLIKNGNLFKMSKRKGDYITVEDLINEVGKDATRFIMLSRTSDVELDFDFSKVKEKTKDNPLYYVQYCYARISSVFKNSNLNVNNELKINEYNFSFEKEEIEIYKKISQWPKCIELSAKNLEPHRIPTYLYELASLFHSYWNMGKDNKKFRFIDENKKISNSKLILLKCVSIIIKSGMNIVGVNTPEKM